MSSHFASTKIDTDGAVLQALVRGLGIVVIEDKHSEVYHASPDADRPHPPEMACVARAAFPTGNRYLRVADELETLFTADAFLALFPPCGQPAQPPWQLALSTLLPCAEGLSDRQAAHAVRSRSDWKYVLRLELTDPGFDASDLSEFRGRLVAGAAEYLLCAICSPGAASANWSRRVAASAPTRRRSWRRYAP